MFSFKSQQTQFMKMIIKHFPLKTKRQQMYTKIKWIMTDISKLDETIQDEDGINQCSEGDISYADEKMNNDITNCTN